MKRLGDILVESGFLNATELAEVLSVQKETGKRLGEVIVESGLMSEFDILRAVSSQYKDSIRRRKHHECLVRRSQTEPNSLYLTWNGTSRCRGRNIPLTSAG